MLSFTSHIIRVIVILALTTFRLGAQSFNPKYNFKQLNVQNGLAQNIVYHFLQDSRGYMWVGTHNGLTLYDGIRTINFLHNEKDKTSIGGNFITCVLEDSAQQIWISNENGIDLYNRTTNSFTHFGVDRPDGTKENTYCVLLGFVSANEVWLLVTKTKSILSLNIKTAKTSFVSALNAYNALLYKSPTTKNVHIWSSYDKGTIHQVYEKNRLISEQAFFSGKKNSFDGPELVVIHIFQQNDTTAWLSTNEGLVKLNPVLNRYRIFNTWMNRPVKNIRFTVPSPNDQLWVASGTDGVHRFDIKTNQFIDNIRNDRFDPLSICSNNIVSLYFDKTGNIWCGSYGNGASYTNTGNTFFATHLSKTETESSSGNNLISWMVTDPHANMWCMFENVPGFLMLDKNLKISKYQNPRMENGATFDGPIYKLLFETNNDAWCSTSTGLYKYNILTNKLHPVKYELISEEVFGSVWIKDIIRLNDSSILFSTFAGLYHITKESGKTVIKPLNFLKSGNFNGFGPLFQDKENMIYVKALDDFFYILKPSNDGKEFTLIKSILFPPDINQYFYSKGDTVVYIASGNGLYHINTHSFQIEKEDLNNKLPFSDIRSIFKKDSKFWVFGEKGLYFFNEKNNESRTFTVEDGLPTNEFSISALIYNQDQRLIAGTANGLVSFFPQQNPGSLYPVRAQLTNIYVNDTLRKSVLNPDETKKINLSFRENTFSFDFAPVTFQHASEYNFEYKLERYDETWIKSGAAHYTRYSKIPPGSYVFNLRITDATGNISPFTKTLEIQVAKAFWQTTLFKIAIIVFVLSIGWLLTKWYFNYKIRKQKQQFEKQQLVEKERTRIATDMHDDLGAGLSRIKFLSETIGMKKQQQQPIEEEISKIREYSHDMIDKMGEIVWALNEKNDSLSDLLSYTRVYAMEYLSQNGIKCVVEAPDHLPSGFVNGEFRRNVYLTVKEALHNVVKHAQASLVTIKIYVNDRLEFSIEDNGVGFDKNKIRQFSNGLTNMENRIKEINGNFVILNGKARLPYGQGTTIKITVPVPA